MKKENLSDKPDHQSIQFQFEAIPIALNRHGVVFSKTIASKLVGGRCRLERLIVQGLVKVEKKALGRQNGKWYCNGGDVIRHIML